MQDIVFYAVANETLGAVRDYTNMFHPEAPVLTIGVAVCLRMRLFASDKGAAPYPIASFDGITNWQWSMDSDFDRSTACKLVADANGISVHTVTDTVDGETASFTEFVIPISNMNTEELAAWLGNDGAKTGLNGELVGYDNEGHSMFVLQIENFKVRNRVAGLEDPTAVDEGIVTRPLAEQMIQTAVSASAATKQDKLGPGNAGTGISITSAGVISTANVPQSAVTGLSSSLSTKQDKLGPGNAGTGISITSAGVISTANVPQSAVTGLEASLSNKQNSLSPGFWIEIDDDWISVERYHTVYGPFSRGTVSMQAGEAYKIYATNSAVTLDAGDIPNNTWGLEGHAEIFIANTGYVQTTSRVVLANALEPDAVNNCTVRFHDGIAIISVEDHIAGYIVVSATGTTAGTLPYGISSATQEYVAFDATLNGSTIDLSGSTANGEKHIVGNGYTSTTLTGEVDCGTSKFTVANLSLQDTTVNGGTMTFGDVFIPSGSTVAVSGGVLAVEKVVGAGSASVIDLGGGEHMEVKPGKTAVLSECSIVSGSASYPGRGGSIANSGSLVMTSVTVSGNTGYAGGGLAMFSGTALISSCGIYGNTAIFGKDVRVDSSTLTAIDCQLGGIMVGDSGRIVLSGSNSISLVEPRSTTLVGTVTLTSGAVLDLTGNTNPTPIAPGGGITFESGGATVKVGDSTASSSYMMDNVTLSAGAKLTNTNVVELGNTSIPFGTDVFIGGVVITGQTTAVISPQPAWPTTHTMLCSGVTFSSCGSPSIEYGGACVVSGARQSLILSSCTFVDNQAQNGEALAALGYTTVEIRDCTFGVNQEVLTYQGANFVLYGTIKTLDRIKYGNGSGTITITSGSILDFTGTAISSSASIINAVGGVIVDGGCDVITSAGSTVSIAGGTYTRIFSDGTTE